MKLTVKEVDVPKPPRRVVLDLSEGEAALLHRIVRAYQHYEGQNGTGCVSWQSYAAAKRLENNLEPYHNPLIRTSGIFPYTNFFTDKV